MKKLWPVQHLQVFLISLFFGPPEKMLYVRAFCVSSLMFCFSIRMTCICRVYFSNNYKAGSQDPNLSQQKTIDLTETMFLLQDCRQPFHGGSFFDHEGLPYCETHYHAKRGSLCAGCHKPITGKHLHSHLLSSSVNPVSWGLKARQWTLSNNKYRVIIVNRVVLF